ncbi:unnamed protein product [Allacma fusca]|uniref:Uncharacterized protein n=1 Tax=Allacma fusca TaxID=39272 RepID=A0A8J2KBQ0_9HEXA|nr:unnamed protein product [Allacma fusca]
MPVFHLVTVICYVEAVQPMIHDLSLNDAVKERRYSENKNVFEEEDINHFYHELSILQQIFNASYSYWALGAQTFLTVFCIANIFQAGALQNPRGLLNAMFQMFLIKLIFKHLAQIYESSAPTLESWRETKGSVWFQKYLRACKPLRVVVGSFYYADNTLILTMISVISANAASMIVAYKGA